tara:strand:- start:206 stop:913 length:708 start_codon:yes stop_codon:yes gene_type:complete
MALPQLNTPSYEMVVPSTGVTVKYRPFLIKEQKVLMIAQETGKESDMARAMCDIVKSCTNGEIKNPEKLPTFDIEYMFLQLRAKSTGAEVELQITCPDDGETKVPVTLDLEEVVVHKEDDHTTEIMITDTIGLKMKYPSMMDISKYQISKTNTVDLTFGIIKDCLESIFDEEQVYEEMTKKELDEFIESMSTDQFGKLQKFFDTMPRVKHTIKVTNPKTNVESDVTIEGLKNFLG